LTVFLFTRRQFVHHLPPTRLRQLLKPELPLAANAVEMMTQPKLGGPASADMTKSTLEKSNNSQTKEKEVQLKHHRLRSSVADRCAEMRRLKYRVACQYTKDLGLYIG